MAIATVEDLVARVELVRGKGERRTERLCVMSFVALLAGEKHTDAPATASPFIRHYAIALNDSLPAEERQRLKLFAPRIIGTNDGVDPQRAGLVHRAFAEEIVPRLQDDLAERWLPDRLSSDWIGYVDGAFRSTQEAVYAFVNSSRRAGLGVEINRGAATAATLLAACAASARDAETASWYWSKSIDLLDRLCDLGPGAARVPVSPEDVTCAADALDAAGTSRTMALLADGIVRRIRRRLTTRAASPIRGGPSPSCGAASLKGLSGRSARYGSPERQPADGNPVEGGVTWASSLRRPPDHPMKTEENRC